MIAGSNGSMSAPTVTVPARDVRPGDRIAQRNVVGGLIGWLVVVGPLDVIGLAVQTGSSSGVYVTQPDEQIEIQQRPPAS